MYLTNKYKSIGIKQQTMFDMTQNIMQSYVFNK